MKIAVIIPTFNRAEMVCQAVESVLGQTVRGTIIVVDDGSTDETLVRLADFGDAITVVAQENTERGAARNAGAALAQDADLLLFMDADDAATPQHLEALCDLGRRHLDASLVSTGSLLANLDLQPFQRYPDTRPGRVLLRDFLLGREALPPVATAIRRSVFEAIGGFEERRDLSGSEDWLLMARALAWAPGVRGTTSSAIVRRHPGNSMANVKAMRASMLLAHRMFFDALEDEGSGVDSGREGASDLRERSHANLLIQCATGHYGTGEMRTARSTLMEAAGSHKSVLLRPMFYWTLGRSLLGRGLAARLRGWKRR
jgi:Glycosyl transferase family 2